MADQSDIEQALVERVSAICYPNGTGVASILNTLVNVSRGWPTEAGVNAAVKAGSVLIAVHAEKGYSRDVTRYTRDWHTTAQTAPTVVATLAGNAITLSGTVTPGNTVGVLCQGAAYTYVAQSGDTLASIAAGLAAEISGASAAGAVLTLPAGGALPAVTVVSGGTAAIEVGRSQQVFAVSAWCPTPALRDGLFAALSPALRYDYRLALPDGTTATLLGVSGDGPDDVPSRMQMFRRDLRLTYDYPLIYTSAAQAAAALLLSNSPNGLTAVASATV